VFIGGTLDDTGGHNAFEAALLGCAIIAGPGDFNFAEPYADFAKEGAMRRIAGPDGPAQAVRDLLDSEAERVLMAAAAARLAGPGDFNFAEPYADLAKEGAMRRIAGPDGLAQAVRDLLDSEAERERMAAAAARLASAGSGATARTADALAALLPQSTSRSTGH